MAVRRTSGQAVKRRRDGSFAKSERKIKPTAAEGMVRRLWSSNPGLDVVHRNAAGIDVGNEEHYVAIAPTQDEVPVQRFNCFTTELIRMEVWLKGRGANGSDAAYGCLLDPFVRHIGGAWNRSVFGECTGHQESARPA